MTSICDKIGLSPQCARGEEGNLSRKLLKSTAVVGVMTLLSRIMGFVRDVVLARVFGADAATDAFFVAFKIPNFLRRLFAEGSFSQAFVPVFTDYKENRERSDLKLLVDQVAGTFGVFLFVLTVIGVVAAPILIMIFGPGFIDEPRKYDLAVEMLRLTYPYLFFIALTAFSGGILNAMGHFAAPAFTPVFLNICLIGAALWLAPMMDEPVVALAWGVFVAGAVQLLFQVPFLWRAGLLPRPRLAWKAEGVQRIYKLMLPAIFGSSVVQLNLLLDTLIASLLVTGSISWLYYSDRLVEFPLGVFGIALATVILPKLSRDHAHQSAKTFSQTLDWALKLVIVIGTPATVGLITLSGPLITTLFFGGQFSEFDVRMSQLSLMAYSLGLLGFILVKVLAPGFFAREDTKTPVKIGIQATILKMGLNVVFVVPLVMVNFEGTHVGLAAATAVSAFLNAGLLYWTLRKQGVYRLGAGWWGLVLQVLLAAAAMAAFLLWFVPALEMWYGWTFWQRMGHLLMWVGLGMLVYFITLLIFGLRPRSLLKLPG